MKRILLCFPLMLLLLGAHAQKGKYDSLALVVLDRMADIIGNLEACSFKLTTVHDVRDAGMGMMKQVINYEVFIGGHNRMLVTANGSKGRRQLWYNGDQLAYYSFDEHNYAIVPAPPDLLQMIDSIHSKYDIEFPAADFLYPAFADDLIENADSIRFLEKIQIDGKEYFQILATGKDKIFQFWISNDAYNLPAKFSVIYKSLPGNPQYFASFSDWQLNPLLPPAMFDFLPPPGANRLRMLAKTDR